VRPEFDPAAIALQTWLEQRIDIVHGGGPVMDFRRYFAVAFAGIATTCIVSAPLAQAEEKIRISDLPAVVKKSVDKLDLGVKWTEASKDTEDGDTTYAVIGKSKDGREVSVELSEKGKVIEIDIELPLKLVPKKVTDACQAKYPKFKPDEANAVYVDDKVVAYDLLGELGDKDVEIRVSADGSKVEITDDDVD
jgi:hypothetical protein